MGQGRFGIYSDLTLRLCDARVEAMFGAKDKRQAPKKGGPKGRPATPPAAAKCSGSALTCRPRASETSHATWLQPFVSSAIPLNARHVVPAAAILTLRNSFDLAPSKSGANGSFLDNAHNPIYSQSYSRGPTWADISITPPSGCVVLCATSTCHLAKSPRITHNPRCLVPSQLGSPAGNSMTTVGAGVQTSFASWSEV